MYCLGYTLQGKIEPLPGPNLDLLCVLQPNAAYFVKIMQSFILMQKTEKRG